MKLFYPALLTLALYAGAAQATTRDAEGLTRLHRAAGAGQASLVESLIRHGEDPLAVDSKMGVSVLHKAIYSGDARTAELLLQNGALINQQSPSNGNTPLHDALYFRSGKDQELVRTLLRHKPSLAIRNRAGFTPLESAKLLGHADLLAIVEAYEQARQSPLSRALMAAVRAKDARAVGELLPRASRVTLAEADEQGFTPLIWAAREGMEEIVAALLAAGADPNQNDEWMQANAGHKAGFWGRAGAIKLLIAAGLDLNARGGYNGYTALHDAVAQNHVEAVKVLVEAGARTDIAGHDGKTPRDLARAQGNPQVLKLLGMN